MISFSNNGRIIILTNFSVQAKFNLIIDSIIAPRAPQKITMAYVRYNYINILCDILPPPNGYAALMGASCDLRRELSTPFAVALALTGIATEGLFIQSPCPGESAKPMRRIFFAALMSLS